MSSGQPLAKAVFVKNPQVDIQQTYQVPILYGPKVTRKQVTTCSNQSTAAINYTEKLPINQLVDRRFFIECTFEILLSGTALSGNIYKPQTDAPRAFPLHQLATNLEAKFNGESVSSQVSDYISALCHYFNEQDYRQSFTGCPCMLDQTQNYDQAVTSERNPLGAYLSNVYQPARGDSNVYFEVVSNTGSAAVIRIRTIEPVLLSPFRWGKAAQELPAFANLQTLDINYTLGDVSRLWSHDNVTNPVTNFQVSWNGSNAVSSKLHYTIISPQDDMMVNNLATYFYEYFNIQRFPTSLPTIGAGLSSEATSQIINPTNCPSRMFVYIRQSNQNLSAVDPDTFFKINSVEVQWNNQTFLSSAETWDLYQMSQANGLADNYLQWSYYTGGVLCLEFAKDIGLDMGMAPGMITNNQLQVTVNYTNLKTFTVNNPSLYIVLIAPGSLEISQGRARANLGVVTSSDIILAKQNPFLSFSEVQGLQPYGGSFFSSVGDFFKKLPRKALDIGKAVVPFVAPQLAPAVAAADTVASAVGLGGLNLGGAMESGGLNLGGMSLGGMTLTCKKMSTAKRGKAKKTSKRGGYAKEYQSDLLDRLRM